MTSKKKRETPSDSNWARPGVGQAGAITRARLPGLPFTHGCSSWWGSCAVRSPHGGSNLSIVLLVILKQKRLCWQAQRAAKVIPGEKYDRN
jgi:hypothetical protein